MPAFQMRFTVNKTFYYAIAIFIVCVTALNLTLSIPAIQRHLPAQRYGSQYPIFEETMAHLDQYVAESGPIDCIFLGSSMTRSGVYPDVFEAAYRRQSGEDINCYNFSLWGLTASSAGALAEVLVEKYHPRLLVYATASRDYYQSGTLGGEHDFPLTPWVRYHNGDMNVAGWLTDNSVLVRYYHTLREMILPTWQDNTVNVVTRISSGFQPTIEQHPVFQEALQNGGEYLPPREDYTISEADLEGLRQILALQDDSLTVLVYEAPTHPVGISSEANEQLFLDTITSETQAYGVVFWEVADRLSIPDADWYDAIHFRITGAVQLSQWLGLQIGEAANRGLFEGLSSLQEPPLQNPQLEPPYYLEHDGVFPETNQSFVEYESLYTLTPPDATILNPSNGLGSRDELQMQLGFFIDWAVEVEPSMYDNLFDFRIVLDRMRFEDELVLDSQSQAALTAWRQTKQASDLHAAGIDYLIFSGEWLSFTSAEEATTLTDPAHYELVATWQHKVSKRQYWLYRVLGC